MNGFKESVLNLLWSNKLLKQAGKLKPKQAPSETEPTKWQPPSKAEKKQMWAEFFSYKPKATSEEKWRRIFETEYVRKNYVLDPDDLTADEISALAIISADSIVLRNKRTPPPLSHQHN